MKLKVKILTFKLLFLIENPRYHPKIKTKCYFLYVMIAINKNISNILNIPPHSSKICTVSPISKGNPYFVLPS